MVITASQARAELFPLIQQVNEDREHIVISSKNGNAVLVSESEWESLLETVYLMRNAELWADIQAGIAEVRSGKVGKQLELTSMRKDFQSRSGVAPKQKKAISKPPRKKKPARKGIKRAATSR